MDNKQKGKFGEKQAVKYLINHGYTIVGINYFSRYGEIDIIARLQGVYVFVEVKTRTSTAYGTPAEGVSYYKKLRMTKTIEDYVQKKKLFDFPLRIDVIEVYLDGTSTKINHIKSAFEGTYY